VKSLLFALPASVFVSCSSGTDSINVIGPNPPPRATSLALRPVASGLAEPVAITHAGDARLFITLKRGQILILENGAIGSTPFLDISPIVGNQNGEQGLLSVAFHPNFRANGFFFVNYTNLAGDTVIARYRVAAGNANEADPSSGTVLLTLGQPFVNHNGGQLQFGPDGKLYVGMGDGGSGGDPQLNGQRDDTLLGKMLRLDVDANTDAPPFYGVPQDNPTFGAASTRSEIWAKGLRNPWRFSFDRLTGNLYIGDVGQDRKEEIDFQPAVSRGGENYGWNVMEGRDCFSNAAATIGAPPCNDAALVPPIIEYAHDGGNCSVTGGYVYRGSAIANLQGAYVYGDFCSGTIWSARQTGGTWQSTLVNISAPQLASFGEDQRGELYLATLSGTVYQLVAGP
jgi:glucose/arabinose dehydrogenase